RTYSFRSTSRPSASRLRGGTTATFCNASCCLNSARARVTTADLARLHVRMKKHPYQANRMLAVVGSLYEFAGKRKLVRAGFNPGRGIDKYPEKGRERFLSGPELAKLGDASQNPKPSAYRGKWTRRNRLQSTRRKRRTGAP